MWFDRKLTPKQRERIEKKLSRGRRSFIWRFGVLGWGIPVFLMTFAWDYYDGYRPYKPFNTADLIFHLAVGLPIWMACGYWFGAVMWRRFNNILETNQR